MQPRVFLDSNVLIYAFTQAEQKTEKARRLLSSGAFVSVHALNETANVLQRKFRTPWSRICAIVDAIVESCPDPLPLTLATHRSALRISERFKYSIYDGLILASALEARCEVLYSEDLQHGQIIDGLRIENPFLP